MNINKYIPKSVWWAAIGLNMGMFILGVAIESTELMILNVLSATACYISLKLKVDDE